MQQNQTHPPLTLETIVSRHTQIIDSALSQTEAVMLNMEKGSYYGVEDVAKFIWDALAEPLSISALCDRIMTHYVEVERAPCEEDALNFVGELVAEDLVYVHTATPVA